MKCEGQDIKMKPCENKAVTTRKNWRFGLAQEGEPLTVTVKLHFCKKCARAYDENREDGAAEARAS